MTYALTRERRRAVCVHEAGHAVIYALGGAFVYRVAVAPEGATEWRTTGRKGADLTDLWGVCSASDSPAEWFLHWNEEDYTYEGNVRAHRELLRLLPPRFRRERFRQIRAHVCASLAGPAAEQLHESPDEEPYLDECPNRGPDDDLTQAEAQAWLLPWRDEFEHLAGLTVATLRRPEVWARVMAVADALEAAGDLDGDDEALDQLLPGRLADWPPSPRALAERHVALPGVAA